jgi:ribosomal protein S27AE
MPGYSLPAYSPADDAGESTSGTKDSLTDKTKYWAINIWQGALLVMSINNQIYTTIVNGNTEDTINFPSLPQGIMVGKNSYVVKRLQPALTRPGINLTATQQSVFVGIIFTDRVAFPYPVPWVQPKLNAGAEVPLINQSTGVPLPLTVPRGYKATLLEYQWQLDQDSEHWIYIDGALALCPGISTAGQAVYVADIVPISTALIDPLALLPHTINWIVKNRGLNPMSGAATVVLILEAVGTPPFPSTKEARCPQCGTITTVPVHTNNITCKSCGFKYVVFDGAAFRRTT